MFENLGKKIPIQDVVIPREPVDQKSSFARELQLSPREWEDVMMILAGVATKDYPLSHLGMAADMMTAFPEKISEIPINQQLLDLALRRLNDTYNQATAFYSYYAYVLDLFPYLVKNRDKLAPISDSLWQKVIDHFNFKRTKALYLGVIIKYLFPEKFSQLPNTVTVDDILLSMQEYSKGISSPIPFTDPLSSFMNFLATTRLYFPPEEWTKISTSLRPEDLEKMRTELKRDRRKKAWKSFMYVAKNMRIILADSVEITEEGIQIIDHVPSIQPYGESKLPVIKQSYV